MNSECENSPLSDRQRSLLGPRLAQSVRLLELPLDQTNTFIHPIAAYTIFFAENLHPYIVKEVKNKLDNIYKERKKGFVYVFHDFRDPRYVVKIGYSTRDPVVRIREWKDRLHTSSIVLLFSVACHLPHQAEEIVHQLLFCQWLPKKINVSTFDRMHEFFRIEHMSSLIYLLKAVTRYLDGVYFGYVSRLK